MSSISRGLRLKLFYQNIFSCLITCLNEIDDDDIQSVCTDATTNLLNVILN